MTTITAAAGGGNWSVGASWVGGVAPGAGDDALLTAASGNITINGTSGSPNLCRSLNCTGYIGTLTQGSTGVLNIGDSAGGSLTLAAGMTYAPSSSSTINFVSTTTGNTITTAGKTMPGNVNFNGAGGGWTFQDNFSTPTSGAGQGINLLAGSLDINGMTVTTAALTSTNATTRSLTLGAANITLGNATSGNASSFLLDFTTPTNLTFSGASSTILARSSNGGFAGGGKTFGTVTMDTTVAGTMPVTGANTFGALTITTDTDGKSSINFAAAQTISGNFTITGASAKGRVLIKSNAIGTQVTITCNGTVSGTSGDFMDIVAAGSASWNLASMTNGSGDCGNNSGITFTTPGTMYWFKDTANWSDATKWFLASGGTGGAGRVPLAQDTAIFDANSFSAGSKIVSMDFPRYGSMNFTGATNTPALNVTVGGGQNGGSWFFGDVTFIAAMTFTGSPTQHVFSPVGNRTFTSNGITLRPVGLVLNSAHNDKITIASALSGYTSLTFTRGNIELSANMTGTGSLTPGAGGSITDTGTNTLSYTSANLSSGAVNVGVMNGSAGLTISGGTVTGGTINCTTLTVTSGTLTAGAVGVNCTSVAVSGTTARTINMGAGTWTISGTGSVWSITSATNLTFNRNTSTINLTDTSASTKTFAGLTATYYNITLQGAAGNGAVTFSGAFTVANTLKLNPDCSVIFTISTTYTVGFLDWVGTSGHLITIATNSAGTKATISCANPVSCNFLSLKDNIASNHTPFYAGADSTNVSGNTSWVFATTAVTGVSGTGSPGTLRAEAGVPLIGVTGTGSAGILTVNGGDISLNLVGVVGNGSPGTVIPEASTAIAGVSGTGSPGVCTLTMSLALGGTQGVGNTSPLTLSMATSLTGVAGTGSPGTTATSISLDISGVSGTGTAGSLTPEASLDILGQDGTGAAGTLTVDTGITAFITGAQAAASPGSLTLAVSFDLSAVGSTAATSALVAQALTAISGVAGTGAAGTLPSFTVGPILQSALAQALAGTVTAFTAQPLPAINLSASINSINLLADASERSTPQPEDL